ncbi:MAG: CoA-disulfide reductase [Gaiellales bacterium]|nr:MAG: CoA-disulfide reductase [Gaiellales bacterium]
MMKIVIVGGVAAGASAAARARRLSEEAEIVLLEKGEFVSFANCGLPYHVSGAIEKRDSLVVVTPKTLREWFNLDVRTMSEVTAIDREGKKVSVTDRGSGLSYQETYDKLILCQGAAALSLEVPGADDPRIFPLRTIPEMDGIIAAIDGGATAALVIGANYIGIEAAEALIQRGLSVDLVELQDQVMPALDREMANDLRFHIEDRGVRVHLDSSVQAFSEAGGRLVARLADGGSVVADLAVMAVGVRPDTALAEAAGLALGATGGVRVDRHMLTSDPDIYAAGDMVEVTDAVTGLSARIPLAGPANRQGRVAANHIFGRDDAYVSTQGSAIVKVFEMTAAITGASEKTLKAAGMDYRKIYLHPYGHASYYPGTEPMHLKLLFAPGDGRLLGAQIVGFDGVDKRIDVLATALRAGMTVHDLEHLELAYAPPYGSAKDPVNMAGFVGVNLLEGDVDFWYPEDFPERTAGGVILDVRTNIEYRNGHIAGALHIPLSELRSRLGELEPYRDRDIFTYCLTGIRSYYALRILRLNGYDNVYNLSGSWKTWTSHFQTRGEDGARLLPHTEAVED